MDNIHRTFMETQRQHAELAAECRTLGVNVDDDDTIETLRAKRNEAASGDSTRRMSSAELHALAALAIVDAESCRAANMQREALGDSMAYDEVQSEAADVLREELRLRSILRNG